MAITAKTRESRSARHEALRNKRMSKVTKAQRSPKASKSAKHLEAALATAVPPTPADSPVGSPKADCSYEVAFEEAAADEICDMSDDDLQRYFDEFEAASQGEYPESADGQDCLDKSEFPDNAEHDQTLHCLSPELESEKAEFEPQPISPISLTTDEELYDFDTPDETSESSIDEYLSLGDNTTESTDANTDELQSRRRRSLFCLYRLRNQTSAVSTTFNPNKRTLLAALETVAADSQYVSQDAYIESVMLAAASLKQRSMVTGLARQTMAPAMH